MAFREKMNLISTNRILDIAKYEFQGLTQREFLSLIWKSLFRNDAVFIYSLKLFQLEDKNPSASNNVTIRKGNISDLLKMEQQVSHLPWEFRCHKYDGVKDFFVAEDSVNIQHISWIYYHDDPNRNLILSPRDAEIKYCLTLPAFRGKGLYPNVLKVVAKYLKEKAFWRVFISVKADNPVSIRGIEKAGFEYLAKINLRKIMGCQVSKRYFPPEV